MLRASVQMSHGQFYLNLLKFTISNYIQNNEIEPKIVQKCIVDFKELDIEWPQIKDIKSPAEAVQIFKLGNTQIQRAMKFFVVDGHCTEHIRLAQMLSKLYKQLQLIETDGERLYALYQRRIDLLGPLLSDINPSVYYNFV